MVPKLQIDEGKKYRGQLSWEIPEERGKVVRKGKENPKVGPVGG